MPRAKAIDSGPDPAPPFAWVTKDLRPRIDLEDEDAIWAILDQR